jgi:hypothetical protein
VDDEEREHRLRGRIRAALSLTLFAVLLLSLAEAAPYLSTSHAWVPALTLVGSVTGIGAAVLTHVAVGSSAFPKAWSIFMPGRGGLRFVALQVVAWSLTVAGMLLPMMPFCMWCLTGQVCCVGGLRQSLSGPRLNCVLGVVGIARCLPIPQGGAEC